jgi:hypothetical protein
MILQTVTLKSYAQDAIKIVSLKNYFIKTYEIKSVCASERKKIKPNIILDLSYILIIPSQDKYIICV